VCFQSFLLPLDFVIHYYLDELECQHSVVEIHESMVKTVGWYQSLFENYYSQYIVYLGFANMHLVEQLLSNNGKKNTSSKFTSYQRKENLTFDTLALKNIEVYLDGFR
jgi:hypothetical protein